MRPTIRELTEIGLLDEEAEEVRYEKEGRSVKVYFAKAPTADKRVDAELIHAMTAEGIGVRS